MFDVRTRAGNSSNKRGGSTELLQAISGMLISPQE
jgi:hypothetical protein